MLVVVGVVYISLIRHDFLHVKQSNTTLDRDFTSLFFRGACLGGISLKCACYALRKITYFTKDLFIFCYFYRVTFCCCNSF